MIRAHKMNDMSSRSHAVGAVRMLPMRMPHHHHQIFILDISFRRRGESSLVNTTLHLIDLAGSENAKDSGATGEALTGARGAAAHSHCLQRPSTSTRA